VRAHQHDVEGAWDLLQRIATLWHSDHLTTVNFIQVDDMPSAAKAHIRKLSEYLHHRQSVAGNSSFTFPLIQQHHAGKIWVTVDLCKG
jgi:hypothetical protein